ncbi:MAG: hypothetical protein KGD68_04465 [Candidatus Lokiarchaeota archaeon]|nr:hypothetical protein [Candidatus Lokiarchaeota archaeon]
MKIALTKVHVRYEINNERSKVEPFDEIEGKIYVTNNSDSDKKLKELYIDLVEEYVESVNRADIDRNFMKNSFQQYFLVTKGFIKAGEEQEYDFKITFLNGKREKEKK